MERVVDFLRKQGAFYVATTDGDMPRLRPFGFIMKFNGKLYFTTGAKKNVSRELKQNPNVQMSACADNGEWLRLSGRAVFDNGNMDAKKEAFKILPAFEKLYGHPGAEDFEVFYLDEADAVLYGSFARGGKPEKIVF